MPDVSVTLPQSRNTNAVAAFRPRFEIQAVRSVGQAPDHESKLGPLRFARPTSVDMHGGGKSARDRTHGLIVQVRGRSSFDHYGHSIQLAAGDLTLCDHAAPYRLVPEEAGEVLVLRIPTTLLKEHLPSPEGFCGHRLAGSDGLCSIAAAMAVSLFGKVQAGLGLPYEDRVARHLLDVIATAYAIAFQSAPNSSIVSGRHATVKLFIEQHLRDPELCPRLVAERLKLSSRYLRMIFATGNETVSAYILRRRLEECARQIGDASWRGHSLTEIAFSWGFNSAPHFTRSFRDRFDMSPRDYRRVKLEAASAAVRQAA